MQVSAIAAADVPAVADFLHAQLNAEVPAASWAQAMRTPWAAAGPNHGFALRTEAGEVVGAYLAFYSERVVDGRTERFCNLGAWCVVEEHRFHSLKLLKALLKQEDYTFTDLSPSGSVPAMNTRLGFETIDTTAWFVPNLPWPSIPGRTKVISDPAAIERILTGRDLEIFRDHAGLQAARQVVLRHGGEHCHVIFRKDRRKGKSLFATLLHVSDPGVLHRMGGPLSRHLLVRHGALVTFAEQHVVKTRPRRSLILRSPRPKMFRSPRLEPAQVDYLYSELTCVAW